MPDRSSNVEQGSGVGTPATSPEDLEALYWLLQTHVGRSDERLLKPVSKRDVDRFALVIGQPSRAPAAASRHHELDSLSDVPVPPLYCSSMMVWSAGPAERDLFLDGTAIEQFAGLPLQGLRLMGAGQELEFLAPIETETKYIQKTTVEDLAFKKGRSGGLIIMKIRRVLMRNGQDVLRCLETFVGR